MSVLTTKALPRRTVLRGMGAALALPFLDAMLPAFSRRAIAAAKPAKPGACTGNLSCVWSHRRSWKSPTQPLLMEWSPRAVFERLFGDSGSTDRAAREARLRQHKSILDSVADKLASLRKELGPQDV